ncbi:TLD-DOMAIN CONTAINING NUCLEOLAR PROTEIN [Salix purpurea]|uniref:TLD-DOMAIN CONTAINING NUCLEOLAR PROTEIN n=1 Tax=Salix purpurea TaxID=77065 RepID=A0A9Q0TX37_SALPP|nr:TLD-DOMAIN CONTAINING NUCLEOLAR PROTEIN [Salix purpurea]
MSAFKEKVSNQLSRLFSGSPDSSSPDNSQARPFSKGENSSSYFPFAIPSLSFFGSRSNKHQDELKPIQSLPVRWNGKDLEQREEHSNRYHECSTICETEEFQNSCKDDKGYNAVCESNQTVKSHDGNDDAAPTRTSSDKLYEFLLSSLPNIVKGCQWTLLYSTLKHGISLHTLIRKSAAVSGPCLLITGDRQGAVFGGLLECPLKPTAKRKYQGTNQSFVFTTIYGEPRIFRPTGANRYYFLCLNDILALGGGGNFALCLDGDLLNGTSGPCQTFGNLCLAHNPEFELKNVEVWGFTHASKYLT